MTSVLPGRQEGGQHLRRYRLRFLAQLGQAAPAQQPKDARIAPFGAAPAGQELALGGPALRGQPPQGAGHDGHAEPVARRGGSGGERAVRPGVPGHQVTERVSDRLGEHCGYAGRQRHAERVAEPASVLDRRPPRLAGYPHLDHPPLGGQLGQPACCRARVGAALGHLQHGQRPEVADHVRDILHVAAGPVRDEPLKHPLRIGNDQRVEHLPQVRLAEQLGEQGRVQRERLGAALGERRIAFVHERADVAEQQRPAERGRGRGLDVHQADPPGGQLAHQADQARHVEDVLQALAHGLQHDRERPVLARHRQQLGGALPLLPEWRPPPWLAPGQQ